MTFTPRSPSRVGMAMPRNVMKRLHDITEAFAMKPLHALTAAAIALSALAQPAAR